MLVLIMRPMQPLSVSMDMLALDISYKWYHIIHVIQYVYQYMQIQSANFRVWFLSLTITVQRFSGIVACFSTSYIFVAVILQFVYQFISQLTFGLLLLFGYNVAPSLEHSCTSLFLGTHSPQKITAGSYGKLITKHFKKLPLFSNAHSHVHSAPCTFPSAIYEVSHFSVSLPIIVTAYFLNFSHSSGYVILLHLGFNLSFHSNQ